jgi:hypothetical protein
MVERETTGRKSDMTSGEYDHCRTAAVAMRSTDACARNVRLGRLELGMMSVSLWGVET